MQSFDFFVAAERHFTQMVENLQSSVTKESHLNILEHDLLEESRKLARLRLQGHIDLRGLGDVGDVVISAEQVKLNHRRKMSRSLYTVFGKISINRIGYCRPRHHNRFPLDASLNLPLGSFSYELQQMLVKEVIKGSFEESMLTIEPLTGVRIGKRQALEIVKQCADDFDSFYQQQFLITKPDLVQRLPIMVLTTDGKGVVMLPSSLREGTRKRQLDTNHKLKHRLSKGEKRNRKRMVKNASIYFIERFVRQPNEIIDDLLRKKVMQKRPRPVGKRIWASVEKDSSEVISELFDEAQRRDSLQSKEWVVLVDGQKHQLKEIKKMAKKRQIELVVILDIIHVIEYLWDAAHWFFDESSQSGEDWVSTKLLEVLNSNGKKVAGSIRMSAAKRNLSERPKKTAETCASYLTNNKQYLDYKTYLLQGYPIGTGVIEGTCRYLIKDRMDITGARWSIDGAEAILKLRSIAKSNDFEEYWNFHLTQEFERNYVSKYHALDQVFSALSS